MRETAEEREAKWGGVGIMVAREDEMERRMEKINW